MIFKTDTAIERMIKQIYNEVYKKIFTQQRIKQAEVGNADAIQNAIVRLQTSKEYDAFCKEFAKKLAQKGLNHQKGLWRKYYDAAVSKGIIGINQSFSDYELKALTETVKKNFEMIKSIPQEMMKLYQHQYMQTLVEQIVEGKRPRGAFEHELRKHGATNAKVIARTEAAKLQTGLTKQRATDIGSVAYIWKSTKDRRTRPSHREMNDVIVFWRDEQTEKPLLDGMNGDAGEFPNCRCDPQPIFDEKDIDKSYYNVYDYVQHKIVNMSKLSVINALENGGIY